MIKSPVPAPCDDGRCGQHSFTVLAPPTSVRYSTALRMSERSKTNVERWMPARAGAPACPAMSHMERTTKKRRRQAHHDDNNRGHGLSSDVKSMEVEFTENVGDGDDSVELAALVAKRREGYGKRQSVTLDILSKESASASARQAGDLAVSTISDQITSLVSTSTSLKIVGYYLRAILAHRLKANARNCYKRLARDRLGLKSSTDYAAYPALYELVQHYYPGLAAATVEAWLENPISTADVT